MTILMSISLLSIGVSLGFVMAGILNKTENTERGFESNSLPPVQSKSQRPGQLKRRETRVRAHLVDDHPTAAV